MNIIEVNPIGTKFDKNNVFLGTLISPMTGNDIKEFCEQKKPGSVEEIVAEGFSESLFDKLGEIGGMESEEFDIFYKTEEGYTRYFNDGSDTCRGDGTDGKGIIQNLVSAWDYFNEDDIEECLLENNEWILGCHRAEPLDKYNEDYNLSK
jgi:hypothetical protein